MAAKPTHGGSTAARPMATAAAPWSAASIVANATFAAPGQYLQCNRSDRTAAVALQPRVRRCGGDLDRNRMDPGDGARRERSSQPSDRDGLNHGRVQRAPATAVEFRTYVAAGDHADHGGQSWCRVPTDDVCSSASSSGRPGSPSGRTAPARAVKPPADRNHHRPSHSSSGAGQLRPLTSSKSTFAGRQEARPHHPRGNHRGRLDHHQRAVGAPDRQLIGVQEFKIAHDVGPARARARKQAVTAR